MGFGTKCGATLTEGSDRIPFIGAIAGKQAGYRTIAQEHADMEQLKKHPAVRRVSVVIAAATIAVALVSALGCTSKPGSKSPDEKTTEQGPSAKTGNQSVAAQSDAGPGINLNCIYDRLKDPPESFHYVYKKNDADGSNVDQEADVTPQAIDGFRLQPDGSQQPIHAQRSDQQSWQAALAGLTGISGMSGTVSTINHNSAMQRESDGGQVNGYQTIHYSIDTARWDATTRQMLGGFALGTGGSEKGDAWVMTNGCPVKLILDDEMHNKDGSLLDKVHYEEAMVEK
jgi:hypothetical protein